MSSSTERSMLLMDALHITVPMSSRDIPDVRDASMHHQMGTRKLDAWLVEANERRRRKAEAAASAREAAKQRSRETKTPPPSAEQSDSKTPSPPPAPHEVERASRSQLQLKHDASRQQQEKERKQRVADTAPKALPPSQPEVTMVSEVLPDVPALEDVNQSQKHQVANSSPTGRRQEGKQASKYSSEGPSVVPPKVVLPPKGSDANNSSAAGGSRPMQQAVPEQRPADVVQPRQVPPRGQKGKQHDGQGQKGRGQKGGGKANGHGSAAGPQGGDWSGNTGQGHMQYGDMQQSSDASPGHQSYEGYGHQSYAGQESSGYSGNAGNAAGHHYNASPQNHGGPGYTGGNGWEYNQPRHQAPGYTNMARAQSATMQHNDGPMSPVGATGQQHQSYPGQQGSGYAGRGQDFPQSGQVQMREVLPLSNVPAAGHHYSQEGHHYNADHQSSGFAGRQQEFAHASPTGNQFSAGHQDCRGRDFGERGRMTSDHARTPSPVYDSRYVLAAPQSSVSPALMDSQGVHPYGQANMAHRDMPSNPTHWSAESPNWQHQGGGQQAQLMPQNQIPQYSQGMQPLQNTQQSHSHHMPMRTNMVSSDYDDSRVDHQGARQQRQLIPQGQIPQYSQGIQPLQNAHQHQTQHLQIQTNSLDGYANDYGDSPHGHQAGGQQMQLMRQNQVPQYSQGMLPLQNTHQPQTQHMQMQTRTVNNEYDDNRVEAMLLTQIQPLDSMGMRGGQGLDELDFDTG